MSDIFQDLSRLVKRVDKLEGRLAEITALDPATYDDTAYDAAIVDLDAIISGGSANEITLATVLKNVLVVLKNNTG